MDEEIRATAPVLPWEISLKNAAWFFQKLPGGGMILKFVPLAQTPQGMMPMAPAVEVPFDSDGWRRFVEDAEAGENLPRPVTAVHLPAGVNGQSPT